MSFSAAWAEWNRQRHDRWLKRHAYRISLPPRVSILDRLDTRFVIAASIICMFGWAYAENVSDDTMKGALIAAFAGAWGYYLGSSNNASRAGDRQDQAMALAHEAVKALPPPPDVPKPDAILEPGQTAQAAPAEEPELNAANARGER